MSGITSKCSQANHLPVRPNPVCACVQNHQSPALVAHAADPLHVFLGRYDDATRTDHGLQNDSGRLPRGCAVQKLNRVFKTAQVAGAFPFTEQAAVRIGSWQKADAWHADPVFRMLGPGTPPGHRPGAVGQAGVAID